VFERFTERARQVIVFAEEEARALGHDSIGTEHLLLGILRDVESVAGRALDRLDITLEEARAQVLRLAERGEKTPVGEIPFAPPAKEALELAFRESLALGDDHIGPEHILLALVALPQWTAARILCDFDADRDTIRATVLGGISGLPGRARRADWAPIEFDVARLEELRERRREAEARGDLDLVAALREEESEMLAAALTGGVGDVEMIAESVGRRPGAMRAAPSTVPLVVAIVLAAAGFPLGLLVGFLIWG
jgi:ATP-dependent Clp protease ATP-binding subunit ClpC